MDNDDLRKIASESIDYEKLLTRLNLASDAESKQDYEDDKVWVDYIDSPIRVISNDGTSHNLELELGNDIWAIESFPITTTEGKYSLRLSKIVSEAQKVRVVYDELMAKLRELSLCWTFSGGSRMVLHSISEESVLRVVSNYKELEKVMLARKGVSRLAHAVDFAAEVIGTYTDFPLQKASEILHSANSDLYLRMMLEYLHQAQSDHKTWYIHLYKIRDTLKQAEEKHVPSNRRFSISNTEWSDFGRILNTVYDLRHARSADTPITTIRDEEKRNVFVIGTKMITNYMDFLDVPHT